ncbi:hypothetical protein D3C87_1723730 [compost metagenome]
MGIDRQGARHGLGRHAVLVRTRGVHALVFGCELLDTQELRKPWQRQARGTALPQRHPVGIGHPFAPGITRTAWRERLRQRVVDSLDAGWRALCRTCGAPGGHVLQGVPRATQNATQASKARVLANAGCTWQLGTERFHPERNIRTHACIVVRH